VITNPALMSLSQGKNFGMAVMIASFGPKFLIVRSRSLKIELDIRGEGALRLFLHLDGNETMSGH
jgi:hypothetical protein